MLLFPKNSKFSKSFSNKKTTKKTENKKNIPVHSNLVLISTEAGFLTNFQIESMRRYLRRFVKRQAKYFFPNFPMLPITKKPNETRLGRGKGANRYWVVVIRNGSILVEMNG